MVPDGPIVVDFETEAIGPRPAEYPPRPVGVGIRVPGSAPMYLAWGHPEGNNCTREHGERLLRTVWADARPKLFHNGEFDIEVAEHEFALPWLSVEQWHDSMLTAFLRDPHDKNYKLKELAERHLGEPPTERDELREWIITNVPEARRAKETWGAYIALAPGQLVGTYCCGDLARTEALFTEDYPYLDKMGMLGAYERERKLIPILVRAAQQGVRVDVPGLEQDIEKYERQLRLCDTELCRYLKTPGLELDNPDQLADAVERAGLAVDWVLTPTGKRSTSKENLDIAIKDKKLKAMLGYREALATCLNTFMKNWLEAAYRAGGGVPVTWNGTRQVQRGRGGARTGRLSSTPNFQNIFKPENLVKAYLAAKQFFLKWLPLPHVRGYIIADSPKHVLLDRDFNQQELRILAHYEGAAMAQAYIDNPVLDMHTFASNLIRDTTGFVFDPDPKLQRKAVKETAFGLIYGMGVPALSDKIECDPTTAKQVKAAYLNTFPSVRDLMDNIKKIGKRGEHITTWGGRCYFSEEPVLIKGHWQSWEYKLINYLIQGSAADCTKEAIIRYDSIKKDGRFLMSVHDENVVCAPIKAAKKEMALLKQAMESIEFNVPMLSTGEFGYRWQDMVEEEKWQPTTQKQS
jgi:DNA polymerase I-like protein with 3'-5' exonuclease and polymerase domains